MALKSSDLLKKNILTPVTLLLIQNYRLKKQQKDILLLFFSSDAIISY